MSSSSISAQDQEDGGGGISLTEILSVIRRRVWLVFAVTLPVMIISVTIVMLLPSKYEASATVQIDPRKRTIVNIESVASDLKTETPIVESEVEVLRSKGVLLRVIEQLKLREDPEFSEASGVGALLRRITGPIRGGSLERDPQASTLGTIDQLARAVSGEPDQDAVASALLSAIKASRVRNSLIIEIKVTTGSPMKSARIANAIVDAYIQEQIDSKTRATSAATELLEQKLDGLRQQVVSAEQKVAQFKTLNNFFDSEGQVLSEKQLARLMEQTVIARNASAEARAKHEHVDKLIRAGADRSGISEVLASHTVKMLKEQEAKVSQLAADLATRYGAMHPQMLKVNAELADLRSKINREVAQIAANVKTEAEVAVERERQLAEALDKLKDQQVVMRDATVRLRELEREASTSRQVFENFLARYKQTTETQGLELADSRIVERADAPIAPSAPKRMILLIAAMGASLAFGLGAAMAIEYAAPGVRHGEEAEQVFETRHLASLPDISQIGAGQEMKARRLVALEPHGPYAEAIRTMRHELDTVSGGTLPRTILICSTLPNDGGSVVASNLALSYAMAGMRTLLVDTDLRRGDVSATLGLSGLYGLADVLEDGLPLADAIVQDTTTGLSALPIGSKGPLGARAPSLLDRPAFARLLNDLKRRFDIVVLDAAPILPVIDGRLVAERVDQIVMAVVWRETPKPLVRRAIRALGDSATRISGIVINRYDADDLARTLGQGRPGPTSTRRAA
ncbi:MAG: polysaccharide biosynthesis tyrosine autokinase [Hyphomicrobiales bacterium]|nr:polysaccharide biosynthesis tyrosine autokinase [Hyphomicrobiales bacterium]